MTALLEKALAQLNDLPEATQDAIASQIFDAIDEAGWTARFSQPNPALRRLADKALAESREGKTVPLDDILDSI